MSRDNSTALGCVSMLLFGVVAYIWSKSTAWGLVAAVAVLLLIGKLGEPSRCDICGNLMKRSTYSWRLEGKKRRVCSHCNESLEREQSRRGMKRYRS